MAEKYFHDYSYEIEERSDNDTPYLVVIIRHESDPEKNIEISSQGGELTLFFWNHHEHYDQFERDDHEDGFRYFCEYIQDIMSDKVIVSTGYRDGTVSYVLASYDLDDHLHREADKKIITSWSGKYDRVMDGS